MNTIDLIKSHVSVRDFEDKPLSDEIKQELVAAAQAGSSSNFVQGYRIIEITDPDMREELAVLSNSAAYVRKTGTFYVFVADLHTQARLLEEASLSTAGVENLESLMVSIVDATIAGQNMALAAESIGLGICYIGGIRNDLKRVKEMLGLPKHTLPVFGLTVGYPASKNEVKPRKPLANVVNENRYVEEDLTAYNEQTAAYYAARGSNQQETNWSMKMTDFFSVVRRPDVADFVKSQGFKLD